MFICQDLIVIRVLGHFIMYLNVECNDLYQKIAQKAKIFIVCVRHVRYETQMQGPKVVRP